MEDKELENEIKERFEAIPDDLRKAITSLPLMEITEDIATKNGLHTDQAGALYTEIIMVLLGMQKASDFEKNIQNSLEISPVTAENVTMLVNEKVFLSVRNTLRQIEELEQHAEDESLRAGGQETPKMSSKSTESAENIGSRDELLAEIEGHMAADKAIGTIPGIQPEREEPSTAIRSNPAPTAGATTVVPAATAKTDPAQDPVARDFVKAKLAETMSSPTQTAAVEPAKAPITPKSYAVDPYREPLS